MLVRVPSVICLAAFASVCAGGCSSGAPREFQLRLVQAEGSALGNDLFSPRFTECGDCVVYDLHSPEGARSIRAESRPRTTLAASEVRQLRVAEVRHPARPDITRWVVWAVPTEEVWSHKFLPIYERFPFDEVLVTRDRQILGVDTVATWDSGIELGRYQGRDEAAAVVALFGDQELEVTWIPHDEEVYEQLRQELRDSLKDQQQ